MADCKTEKNNTGNGMTWALEAFDWHEYFFYLLVCNPSLYPAALISIRISCPWNATFTSSFQLVILKAASWVAFLKCERGKKWALVPTDPSHPFSLSFSIHPRDKRTVAYRLHLGALSVAYGEKSIIFQGPYPQRVQVNETHRLLNITFEECVQLRHMDNKTFEVKDGEEMLT